MTRDSLAATNSANSRMALELGELALANDQAVDIYQGKLHGALRDRPCWFIILDPVRGADSSVGLPGLAVTICRRLRRRFTSIIVASADCVARWCAGDVLVRGCYAPTGAVGIGSDILASSAIRAKPGPT